MTVEVMKNQTRKKNSALHRHAKDTSVAPIKIQVPDSYPEHQAQ